MLDILEKFVTRKGYGFSRLDGATPTGLRQSLVDDFNSSPSKQVFLSSTKAGGLGLSLVSANRVVIFDPNWYPAQDLQAQDRSFRFGQKRHVVVFRLLAAGSLEELVYSHQVYKQQLSNIAVSGNMEKRYFEGVQDCKEFQGELFGICNLFRDLSDKLFTSEIIELHENKKKEEDGTNSKQDLNKEITAVSLEAAESSKDKEEEYTAVAPVLEDLDQREKEQTVHLDYPPRQPKLLTVEKRKSDAITGKENVGTVNPIKMRKKSQYSLLARFMGMEEVQFSKWLLSATPAKREKVLKRLS
ncbi:hypothetical protein RND71_012742 [Anisodus tanguticus]|uniref:Helicase C-terminal domain-containing protein n=1 Tax=Anisodus tanguticus TaxID=243964 RepID=A0AAE1VQZ6_9SOLA|nr:hypothetical protein RND71_012742 [Anisodus tanguticus]